MNLKKNNTQDFIDRLKGIKEPRDGKRVSVGYLNKAVKAITRIGNLSNKTNYKYEESQVTEIYHTLMNAVTVTISRFGVDDVKKRFQRLIDRDLKQYLELKKSDPLLYDYIQDHLNNPVIEEYLKEKEKGKGKRRKKRPDVPPKPRRNQRRTRLPMIRRPWAATASAGASAARAASRPATTRRSCSATTSAQPAKSIIGTASHISPAERRNSGQGVLAKHRLTCY